MEKTCTINTECISGYCNGTCQYMPRYYFDFDCDKYGNGTFVESISRPSFAGCVNTTNEVLGIDVNVDCNDFNDTIFDGCVGSPIVSFRWYFDCDCDGYRNSSLSFVINTTRPLFPSCPGGCVNTSAQVLGIGNASRTDCDDSNSSING